MKQHIREIVVFLGILLSVLLFNSTYAQGADLTAAQQNYGAKCVSCHGKDAKGVVKMSTLLKVDPSSLDMTRPTVVKLTDEATAKSIAVGKKKMPKYTGKLTAQEIADVVQYLRSLQGISATK